MHIEPPGFALTKMYPPAPDSARIVAEAARKLIAAAERKSGKQILENFKPGDFPTEESKWGIRLDAQK